MPQQTQKISPIVQMCSLRSSCGWLQLFWEVLKDGKFLMSFIDPLMNSCCQYWQQQFIKRRINEWPSRFSTCWSSAARIHSQTFVRIFYSILKVPTVIWSLSCARFVAAHTLHSATPTCWQLTKSPQSGLDFQKFRQFFDQKRRFPSVLPVVKKVIQKFRRA